MDNLVINADDFGYSKSVNEAIIKCFECEYINQTSIMTNMPFFQEAVSLAIDYNLMDKVGLHINLTEGVPLSDMIKDNRNFCGVDGYFNHSFKQWRICHRLTSYDKLCLSQEIEAQMNKYIDAGFTLMHFDSHHHVHTIMYLYQVIRKLAKKKKFVSSRISRNLGIDSINIVKKIYKILYNKFIRMDFFTTKYFGSYSDFEQYRGVESVEIMVHPDMLDGEIMDVIDKNLHKGNLIKYYRF